MFQGLSDVFEYNEWSRKNDVVIKFKSGEWDFTKEKVFRVVCVIFSVIAILVSVAILHANNKALSFLQPVEHKWAWLMIGGAGVAIAPNLYYFASCAVRDRKFKSKAKEKLAEFGYTVVDALQRKFEYLVKNQTRYDSYSPFMTTNGEKVRVYLYVEKGQKTLVLPQSNFEKVFEAQLKKKFTFSDDLCG